MEIIKHKIKLFNFQDKNKFNEFVDHLDTQTKALNDVLTFVNVNDSILIEFEPHNIKYVYYYNDMDFIDTKPIVKVGVDCTATTLLTDGELELLECKAFM
jgi:hypothetical protein